MVQEQITKIFQFLYTEKKWRWYAALTVFAVILVWLNSESTEPKNTPDVSVDTYIPDGFQLVPLEVANYEALDSVLGQYGVVDLYSAGENDSYSKPIARSVKILRAPLNPSQFAVLIADAFAGAVVKQGPIYKVVIRNPSSTGTKLENVSVQRTKIFHDDSEE